MSKAQSKIEWNKELKELGFSGGNGYPFGVSSFITEWYKEYGRFIIVAKNMNGKWDLYVIDRKDPSYKKQYAGEYLKYFDMLKCLKSIVFPKLDEHKNE